MNDGIDPVLELLKFVLFLSCMEADSLTVVYNIIQARFTIIKIQNLKKNYLHVYTSHNNIIMI